MHVPIPLLCDRCRAEGMAGEDPFARYADLLDFEPVPRRQPRADGWDAEVQRAYVAVLAATGSSRQAAHAVGKAQFGADQLRKAKGSESFIAACERAETFYAENRSLRLAEGVRAVTAAAQCRAPRPAWGSAATRQRLLPSPAETEAEAAAREDQEALDWLERILRKYVLKLEQERRARLGGEIPAADFYLRQLTFLEVLLDLAGTDGFALLRAHRESSRHLVDIAETPMSRLLGEARRMKWAELGDPPRPEHPPRRYLEDHGPFSTEPVESATGGLKLGVEEQFALFRERHAREAEAQIQWEAKARRFWEKSEHGPQARRHHSTRKRKAASPRRKPRVSS